MDLYEQLIENGFMIEYLNLIHIFSVVWRKSGQLYGSSKVTLVDYPDFLALAIQQKHALRGRVSRFARVLYLTTSWHA